MFEPTAAYVAAAAGMIIAALSALAWISTVNHLDPPGRHG